MTTAASNLSQRFPGKRAFITGADLHTIARETLRDEIEPRGIDVGQK